MSDTGAPTLDGLITSTRERLISLIRETCGDRPTVHLALCNHLNVGDVALNVAEYRLLRVARAHVTMHTTSDRPNPPAAPFPRGAAFVVHGGGNIGDLYPSELAIRIQALLEHPGRPMLQMPQSIYFQDLRNADEYRAAVGAAKRYVLLTRDLASYDWALHHLDCRVELVPDAALTLGRLDRSGPPAKSTIALMRSDAESTGGLSVIPTGVEVVDWPQEGRFRHDPALWSRWLIEYMDSCRVRLPSFIRGILFQDLSGRRLHRGLVTLSEAKYIITDRLHGHILSSLLGIPQIVIDNSYGKVWGFMDTWRMDSLVPVIRAGELRSNTEIDAAVQRLASISGK